MNARATSSVQYPNARFGTFSAACCSTPTSSDSAAR